MNPLIAEGMAGPDMVARNQLAPCLDNNRGGEHQLKLAFPGERQKLICKPAPAQEGAYKNRGVEDSSSYS